MKKKIILIRFNPITHIGKRKWRCGNVSFAILKYAIPPIDRWRFSNRRLGSNGTIKIPRSSEFSL